MTARQCSHDLASEFEVTIEGAPGRSAGEILRAFDASVSILAKQIARDVGYDSLQDGISEMLVTPIARYDDMGERALQATEYEALAGKASFFKKDFERYDGIDATDLRDTLVRWVTFRSSRVTLGRRPGAHAGGERKARRFTPAVTP